MPKYPCASWLLRASDRVLDLCQRAERLEARDVAVQARLRERALRVEVFGRRHLAEVALLRDDGVAPPRPPRRGGAAVSSEASATSRSVIASWTSMRICCSASSRPAASSALCARACADRGAVAAAVEQVEAHDDGGEDVRVLDAVVPFLALGAGVDGEGELRLEGRARRAAPPRPRRRCLSRARAAPRGGRPRAPRAARRGSPACAAPAAAGRRRSRRRPRARARAGRCRAGSGSAARGPRPRAARRICCVISRCSASALSRRSRVTLPLR